MTAPYHIWSGEAGLWRIEKRDGETYGLATFTFDQAVQEVCRLEAYRLAGTDFALHRYYDTRRGWTIAVTSSGQTSVARSVPFASWEEAALFLLGVRDRERWRTMRRLEQALSLPSTPLPGLYS